MRRGGGGPFAAVFMLGAGLFWFSDTVADPDLWGHVRFGQDMLRSGQVLQRDMYSYRTAGQRWINHEWLSELIFAGLHGRLGPVGLTTFKTALSLLLVGLAHGHLVRRGFGPGWAFLVLALICVPFRMGLGTVRPQMFTYLGYLLLLLVLEARSSSWWRVWVLPVLFGAWVNLHGGVLAGAGALGVWTVARVARRPRASWNELAVAGACATALLLNPYGAALITFLVRTATVPRPEILEWAPLALMSLPGVVFLVLLTLGTVGLALSERPRPIEIVVLFGLTALLTISANRHYPLFALTWVVCAGEHVADVARRWRPNRAGPFAPKRFAAVVCAAAGLMLIVGSLPRLGGIRVEPFYFPFPARAVALLKQSGVRGNLAVPFNWGEYVIWHLGPAVKVSIDGRRETVYSDTAYAQSRALAEGSGAWDALLKESATDLVLVGNGSPPFNLLALAPGWLPLYQDSFCALFVREGFAGLDRLRRAPISSLPPDGDRLRFPAP